MSEPEDRTWCISFLDQQSSSDSDDDTGPGECQTTDSSTSGGTPKGGTPGASRKPCLKLGFHPGWTVEVKAGDAEMTYVDTATSFTVPVSKFNKAAIALDPHTLDWLLVPSKRHCNCQRACPKTTKLSVNDVLSLRRAWFESTESNLVLAAKELRRLNRLSANAEGVISDKLSFTYRVDDVVVCSTYWQTVMSVSDHTLKKARRMARANRFITAHAGLGLAKATVSNANQEPSDALKCHAFWTSYFDTSCQRPNDKTRLFPCAQSFPTIFRNTFLAYAARMNWESVPKMGVFRTAATHSDFADVKTRPQHTHVRCDECTDCTEQIGRAFRTGAEKIYWMNRWNQHQNDINCWRQLETYYTQRAQVATPLYC